VARPGRPAIRPARPAAAEPAPFDVFQAAEHVFTAKLKTVTPGPVARSSPPIYTHRLALEVVQVLRGGRKVGEEIVGSHSARQHKRPTFPVAEVCIVAGKIARGTSLHVTRIDKATESLLATARLATSLPLGWTIVDDKPVSPWAALGPKAWPKGAKGEPGRPMCAKTGRPALLAGKGVRLTVAPVPPKKKIKWTNPDGDGEYTITVTNTTDKPLAVPCLLSDGGKILWDDSLVILCQGTARPAPGAKGVAGKPVPTTLKAGQSVSTVVNAFRLTNVKWPRGGYRIEFRFCLGELSSTQSFYYLSRHHDKVRKAATAKEKP